MLNNDFRWGCRSGIQKAIRRGDLDLANTCFNTLWRSKEDRHWLFWRSVILVTEEAWQLIGELSELILLGSQDEAAWRGMIYKTVAATKSKDAEALLKLYLANGNETKIAHSEYELLLELLNHSIEYDRESISDYIGKIRELSEYEQKAFDLLASRAMYGGQPGDRRRCIVTILLLALRGITKDLIDEDIRKGLKLWRERVGETRNPVTVNLPWYVFDLHTKPGLLAYRVFVKKYLSKYKGMSERDFKRIWFHAESAHIPNRLLECTFMDDGLTALQSRWWMPWLATALSYNSNLMSDTILLWRKEIRSEVQRTVSWIIRKRDYDEKEKGRAKRS